MPEVIRNATVATGVTTSTEIAMENVGQNSQRSLITITNLEALGGNVVYLSWGEEAAANKGLPLAPQATYIESMDAGYKPSNRQINGYSAAAVNLAIQERTLIRG